jgi:hypothetical protein
MRTKANPPTQLPDDADSVSEHFYVSDGVLRVTVNFPAQNKHFDRAINETSLTAGQKTTLRALLLAVRDDVLSLEGYT